MARNVPNQIAIAVEPSSRASPARIVNTPVIIGLRT